jgi:hypothetical protein
MGLVILGILAAAVLGGIIYLFFSPKSSHALKLAALAALVVSCLTLGVCAVVLFNGSGGDEEAELVLPIPVEPKEPATASSPAGLIVFLVLLLAFFGFIIFMGIRDQKKRADDKTATGLKGPNPDNRRFR